MYSNLFPSASNNKRQHSPYFLNPADLQILAEPEIYRKRGERVEDALYRDSQKRSARHKLMIESVSLTFTMLTKKNKQVALFMNILS
jgi:hypothetical protein